MHRWIALAMGTALVALALVVLALPGQPILGWIGLESEGPPRAVILDQLDLTYPNADFARSATETLEAAGYQVDYYRGHEVTVELFRNLPGMGYDSVIMRAHSGLVVEVDESGRETEQEYVSIFTGEPFSETKYVEEVQSGPLGVASSVEGGPEYFGIGPSFIESHLNGRFDDTTIILMGCDGLRAERMARAFLDRGASTFVSWDKPVSAGHTDEATELLLDNLYLENEPLDEAVAQTMAKVGPDPSFDSSLLYYPTEQRS